MGFTGLAWFGAGAIAVIGAVQLWWIPREKNDTATVTAAMPYVTPDHTQEPQVDVVHVTVVQTEEV